MTRKLALAAILLTMAVAALPPARAAPVTVGLGDQSWNIFSDHYFQALGLKRVRVVTPWNVALFARRPRVARRVPRRGAASPGSSRS